MSTTPEIIVGPFLVNATPTASVPKVAELTNGNILVVYITELGGQSGTRDGFHIRGQQFDKSGSRIGSQLFFDFPDETDTKNLDMVALDGNKVAILADVDLSLNKDTPTVRVFRISDNGSVSIASTDTVGGTAQRYFDFALTESGDCGWMAHTTDSLPLGIAFGFLTTDSLRQETDKVQVTSVRGLGSRAAHDDNLESTTLVNGDIVLMHDRDGDQNASGQFEARMIGTDGRTKRVVSIDTKDRITYDGAIRALQGGGFVVAYTEDTGNDKDVVFQLFNADGDVLKSDVNVGSTGPTGDNNNGPEIGALEDGGFIIFYEKDRGQPQIRGQRYTENAEPLGEDFLVANENGEQIDATLLSDGRIAVTYTLVGRAGFFRVVIVNGAPEVTLRGTEEDDALSGTRDDDVILGRAGNDTLSGNDGDDTLDGGLGNDLLVDNRGNDNLRGGPGNDKLDGGARDDTLEGGLGNDRLIGGIGSDRFTFRDGHGRNEIVDFDAGRRDEKIDLRQVSAITSFADLQANHLVQEEQGAVIRDGRGLTILLTAVDVADLDESSFLF